MLLRVLFSSLCLFLIHNSCTATEPNLCDAKEALQCENYQTCCPDAIGEYGCCPFTAANCCPSTDYCCPAGFQCGNSSCVRMDT